MCHFEISYVKFRKILKHLWINIKSVKISEFTKILEKSLCRTIILTIFSVKIFRLNKKIDYFKWIGDNGVIYLNDKQFIFLVDLIKIL